jgi:hypothetical protein
MFWIFPPRVAVVADSCCRPRARSGHAATVDDLLLDSDLFACFFYIFLRFKDSLKTHEHIYRKVETDLENLHLLLLLAYSFGVLCYFSWFS